MSVQSQSSALVLDLTDDPAGTLEAAAWALAALGGTLGDAATRPVAEVLASDPQRTAVLDAVGLISRDGGTRAPYDTVCRAEREGRDNSPCTQPGLYRSLSA